MNKAAPHKLSIPHIGEPLLSDYQDIVSKIVLNGVSARIDQTNWAEYPYQPMVRMYAGYSETYLWIHYEVEKDFFRGQVRSDQGAVWEDSCVEFFIANADGSEWEGLSNEKIVYRNFEFNALGICLSAVGNVGKREFLEDGEMKQILRYPGLSRENLPAEGDLFNWKLTVAIPLRLLNLRPGSIRKANFYKCGDLTQQPHFLSLFCITSESPDFHLPQFFGEVELVK